MEPYIFEPYLKTVIWGGEKIAARKGIADAEHCIGESWEISGVPGHESVVAQGSERGLNLVELIRKHGAQLVGQKVFDRFGEKFPLLIKIIDAKSDLSVQVHPDDALAGVRHNSLGKTEMWYILESEPGARIYAGLSEQITPELYEQLVAENKIMDVIAAHESNAGDLFFLPAGRVHAIGGGNMLAEIQQTSDITYRIYDYDRRDANGNPRELHTALAKDAIDYTVYPEYKSTYVDNPNGATPLVECEHFKVAKVEVDGATAIAAADDSFLILICVGGACELTVDGTTVQLPAYHSALVPAAATTISAEGKATLLTASF